MQHTWCMLSRYFKSSKYMWAGWKEEGPCIQLWKDVICWHPPPPPGGVRKSLLLVCLCSLSVKAVEARGISFPKLELISMWYWPWMCCRSEILIAGIPACFWVCSFSLAPGWTCCFDIAAWGSFSLSLLLSLFSVAVLLFRRASCCICDITRTGKSCRNFYPNLCI